MIAASGPQRRRTISRPGRRIAPWTTHHLHRGRGARAPEGGQRPLRERPGTFPEPAEGHPGRPRPGPAALRDDPGLQRQPRAARGRLRRPPGRALRRAGRGQRAGERDLRDAAVRRRAPAHAALRRHGARGLRRGARPRSPRSSTAPSTRAASSCWWTTSCRRWTASTARSRPTSAAAFRGGGQRALDLRTLLETPEVRPVRRDERHEARRRHLRARDGPGPLP